MNIKFVIGLVSGFILGFCLNQYLTTHSDTQPLTATNQPLTATPTLSQQEQEMRSLSKDLFFPDTLESKQPVYTEETTEVAQEKLENEAAENHPLQEKYAAMDAHFQSIEFTKAASQLDLANALPELTLALALSDEQTQALTKLLNEKNDAEIELLNPYYQSKMQDMDANPFIEPQNEQAELDNLNLERDAINQRFTSKLSQHLSDQQITRYHQFEQQKLAQQAQYNQFFSSQSYFAMLPSLDASQKQVILDLHQQAYEQQLTNLEVKIGSFGTAHPQNNEVNFFQNIDMQINQILTAEQLATKKKLEQPY